MTRTVNIRTRRQIKRRADIVVEMIRDVLLMIHVEDCFDYKNLTECV